MQMEDKPQIATGQYTSTVYTAIQDGRYLEAIEILQLELQDFPRSKEALSLLGYCYYITSNFTNSAQSYEKLIDVCPNDEEYKLYHAQSLYSGGHYNEAVLAAAKIKGERYSRRVLMLQYIAKYDQGDLVASKVYLDQCDPKDPDVIIKYAAISLKEGNYESARAQYAELMNTQEAYRADLAYNVALCYFNEQQFDQALLCVDEIIDKGLLAHPELSTDGASFSSSSSLGGKVERPTGTQAAALKETCLVEAVNLKAAIKYEMQEVWSDPSQLAYDNNCSSSRSRAAREVLHYLPPRQEFELDPVSLHNQVRTGIESVVVFMFLCLYACFELFS
jgi:tetratricopeptide repeat protein 30